MNGAIKTTLATKRGNVSVVLFSSDKFIKGSKALTCDKTLKIMNSFLAEKGAKLEVGQEFGLRALSKIVHAHDPKEEFLKSGELVNPTDLHRACAEYQFTCDSEFTLVVCYNADNEIVIRVFPRVEGMYLLKEKEVYDFRKDLVTVLRRGNKKSNLGKSDMEKIFKEVMKNFDAEVLGLDD